MTDAEKVSTLRSAIERADKALDWILEQPGHSEWMMTTASRVRRILRAAIRKIDKGKPLTAAVRTAPLADTASSDKAVPGSSPTQKQEADDHVDN